MDLKNIIAVKIRHSRFRTDYQTFYFSQKWLHLEYSVLFFINKGMVSVDIKGRRCLVGKNNILIWNPGAFREAHLEGEEHLFYYVLGLELITENKTPATMADIGFPHRITPENPGAVRSILKAIDRSFHSKDAYRMQTCSALGLKLLKTLASQRTLSRRRTRVPQSGMDERINRALDYLVLHYKQRIGVETLAEKACMHRVPFTRLFKRETGLPPHAYVMAYKIQKAKDFLIAFEEPLLNAGEELGFHDYSHFFRAFKRLTGLTPSQYVNTARQ